MYITPELTISLFVWVVCERVCYFPLPFVSKDLTVHQCVVIMHCFSSLQCKMQICSATLGAYFPTAKSSKPECEAASGADLRELNSALPPRGQPEKGPF